MKKIDRPMALFILLVDLALILIFYFENNFLAQCLVMMGLMIFGGVVFMLCETDKKDKEDK